MHLLHQLKVFGVNLPLWLQGLIALITDPDKAACEDMQRVSTAAAQSRLHALNEWLALWPGLVMPMLSQQPEVPSGQQWTAGRHCDLDATHQAAHPASEDLLSSTSRFSLFLKILPPWCMSSCATSPWSPRTASCEAHPAIHLRGAESASSDTPKHLAHSRPGR